jgi:hypothetical protein
MRFLCVGDAAHKFWLIKSSPARAVLVLASGLLCCLPIQAASNRASARLRIEVTIMTTVQSTPVPASNTGTAGAISYSLQTTKPAVSQTTIRAIPAPKLQELSSSLNMVSDHGPAILQTLTIVGE